MIRQNRLFLLPFLALLGLLFQSAPTVAEPKIIEVVSPKGITAWLVRETSIPMISLSYQTAGGASYDPRGKEGLSNLAISLLDEGAGDLDSLAWQARLDDLAISISFYSGADSIGGELVTLKENKDMAFDMLRTAMRQPRFDKESVERIRRQIVSGIKAGAERPRTLMRDAYYKLAYPGHPYGRPRNGTAESVSAITREDLMSYAKKRLTRQDLIVGVVGDITPEELARRLDQLFADLPTSANLPKVNKAKLATLGHLEVVQKNIPQSLVRFVMPGLTRSDPDFYAAELMNRILGGGGLTSRLYKAVREERGLAYGVSTYLSPRRYAETLAGGTGTVNAKTKEALNVIIAEMKRMRDHGATETELRDAKTYVNGSFPLRFTSSGRISNFLVAVQYHNLGIDYISKRSKFYEAVTVADVKRAAKRLLKPENMLTLIVGKPVGLKTGPIANATTKNNG